MFEPIQPWVRMAPPLVEFALVVTCLILVGHFLVRPPLFAVFRRIGLSDPIRDVLENSFTILLVSSAVMAALSVTGVEAMPTSSGALLAALTLTAGIGAREILRNLVSGFFIVSSDDIDIGSWIEWDGHTGVVTAISLRVTKIQTFDEETIVVPNSKLTDGVVVNPASSGRLRLRHTFTLSYTDDLSEAATYIREEARAVEGIADDPPPAVRVIDIESFSIELDARVWITGYPDHSEAVRVRSEFLKRVKTRFQQEGIATVTSHHHLDSSQEFVRSRAD